MPFVANSQGDVTVVIGADASGAADEIQDEFGDAIAAAMKDPQVAAAIRALIREITRATQGMAKSNQKAFNDLRRTVQQTARSMTQSFQQVGRAAQQALKVPTSNVGLNTLNQSIVATVANFDKLATNAAQALRVVEDLNRSARTDVRARAQEQRDITTIQAQAIRERNAQLQNEQNQIIARSRERVALINAEARITSQRMQTIRRIIELTWRSATQAVRGFVQAAGAALRGLARIAQSTFQGMQRASAAAFRGFGRGIQGALNAVSRAFQAAFRRDENALRSSLRNRERALQQSLGRQAQAQQRFQQAQRTGLLGGLGGGGALAGVGAGAGVFGLLTQGFERFGLEERLQLQFSALLGNDAQRAQTVLQDLSAYARETAFSFEEVAGSTAQLTAAFEGNVDRGIELTKFLSDVTALTGGTTQQLSAARLAFAQIAAAGRLEGQELNQLLESLPGAPIVRILADRFFGGDTAAFQKARREGELGGVITAEGFFQAFQEGMQERFPQIDGFAQEAANTVTGRLANLKESFGVFGASLIGLVDGPIKSFFGALTSGMETVGAFISGEMFKPGTDEVNPFTSLMGLGTIPFEELPQEMQDILAERNGWGPNEGFVLASSHAAKLWDELHPQNAKEINRNLEQLRKVLINIGKSLGVVLGLVAGFKLLKLALIALTSPLGLVVLGVSAIAAAFTFMYENSKPLRDAVAGLQESFGELFTTIRGGVSRFGENISTALFGNPDLWANLGDQVAKVVEFLDRGVQSINNFLTGDIEPGTFLDNIHDAIFGEDDRTIAEQMESQILGSPSDREGLATRILNVLEETFLGPVVRFIRGPLADVAGFIGRQFVAFGGFLGDIFNAIFGDGPGGVGTRVLDVLQDTFLGPVVSFFREGGLQTAFNNVTNFLAPAFTAVSDAVSSFWTIVQPIAQPIIDWFIGIKDAITNLDFSNFNLGNIAAGAGIGGLLGLILGGPVGGIAGALGGAAFGAGLGGAIADAIDNAWDLYIFPALDDLWGKITAWFAAAFTFENLTSVGGDVLGFIAEIGNQIANIATHPAFVGALAGLIVAGAAVVGAFTVGLATGLADAIVEWSNLISDALESAWEAIAPDFIPDPIADAISSVLSSPVTGLVTAIGGAALGTVIVRSLIGGITQVGPSLISGAGGLAGLILGKGGPKDVGAKPFDQAAKTKGFQSLGAAIGGAFITGLGAAAIGGAAGRAGGAGNVLLGILTGGALGASVGFSIGGPLGALIGGGLGAATSAISAFFSSTSEGAKEARDRVSELADSIEGIGDLAPGQLLQTNLFEALTDDEGRLEDFGQRLVDSGFTIAGFVEQVRGGVADVDDIVTTFIEDALVNLQLFSDSFGEISGAQLFGAIKEASESGDFENFGDFLGEVGRNLADLGVMNPQGVISDFLSTISEEGYDAETVFRTLTDAETLWADANQLAGDRAEAAGDQILTFDDAVNAIKDSLAEGDTANQIAELLTQDGTLSEQNLAALNDVLGEVTGIADEARSALAEFFRTGSREGEGVEDFRRQFRIELPDIQEQLDRQIEEKPTLAVDIETTSLTQIEDDIRAAIAEAVDTKEISTPEDFAAFIEGLRTDVENSGLRDSLIEQITGILDEIAAEGETAEGVSLFGQLFDAEANRTTIETAITDAKGIAIEAFNVDEAIDNTTFFLGLSNPESSRGALEGAGRQARDMVIAGFTGSTAGGGTTAVGITGPSGGVSGIGSSLIEAVVTAIEGATDDVAEAGREVGTGFAQGLASTARAATIVAVTTSVRVASAFSGMASAMFDAGSNAGNALARGLISQVRAAATAAAIVATAVVQAARNALQISSPSRVFMDIGKQVGQGFIQGIKDAEGDMAAGMASALEGAVETAVKRAGVAVQRAQASGEIFNLLLPSILPGGTSRADLRGQRAGLVQVIRGFGSELRSNAGSLFGETGAAEIGNSIRAMQGIASNLAVALEGITNEFNEAKEQQAEINRFNAIQAKKRRGTALTEAEQDILDQGRPDALTFAQRQILQVGPRSLSAATLSGAQNIESISSALELIRDYGQTAIAQGTPLSTAIANMQRFRDQLVRQASAAGFNAQQIAALVDQFGLSNRALTQFRQSLVSLDQNTIAGAQNIQNFQNAAQQIRDFASALLEAGYNTTQVSAEVRLFRDQLVNQAVAFGFNRAQLNTLIDELGLSNTRLTDFINQMKAFEAAAKNAAAVAAQAAREAAAREAEEKRKEDEEKRKREEDLRDPGGVPIPRVGELHVHIPSGDPEAVALVTANRLAYDSLSSW